jgi:uncharacterized protein (DUF433 family)
MTQPTASTVPHRGSDGRGTYISQIGQGNGAEAHFLGNSRLAASSTFSPLVQEYTDFPRPEATNIQEYIHSDTRILSGKPVVRGTRLSVEFILGLFASGWSQEQVLRNYPTLTPQSIQAVFAFAAEEVVRRISQPLGRGPVSYAATNSHRGSR